MSVVTLMTVLDSNLAKGIAGVGHTGGAAKLEQTMTAKSSLEPARNIRTVSEYVRFGSEADMRACVMDVRFTPESGHY